MKKFFKTLFLIGGSAAAAHFGLKAYRRINGIVKLSKSLPEFLSNVYGEFPKLDINQSFSLLSIKIGFSQEVLDKHDDIENTVREYIDDFYPEIAKCSIDIDLHIKGEDEGEDELGEIVEDAQEKAEEIMDKAEKVIDKAEDKIKEAKDKAEDILK
jgi:hypothetical protein